ncbi:MAG: sporulation integral membrane protein YlbJ [Limnochordia bacterium]
MKARLRLRIRRYTTAAVGVLFAFALVVFPKNTFQASLEGVKLWFDVILPALFPFLVTAELLIRFGVIHWLGTLLEPVMYPLFRIPGAGAAALAMGLASGFPLGAKVTADLRRNQLISRVEAERLVSFANTASPLFIAGAVAVGMLGRPETALALLAAQYAATLAVGICMRFHGSFEQKHKPHNKTNALFNTRAKVDSFGSIFYEVVLNSFKSLIFIGGCITFFSVLARTLSVVGIIPLLARLTASVFGVLGINAELAGAAIAGILEIDIGIQAISMANATPIQQLVAVSAVIGWSGLSVHAQVAAMLQGTDISIKPYIVGRIIHAVCAGTAAALLYRPAGYLWESLSHTIPAIAGLGQACVSIPTVLFVSLAAAGLTTAVIVLLALFAVIVNRIVIFRIK